MIALLLWLGLNAIAGDPPPCIVWSCSNDPAAVGRDGILGDESLVCDPAAGATYYEWCNSHMACLITTEPSVVVAGTPLVAENDIARIKVRACNDADPSLPPGCSAWASEVEFLPHACVETVRVVPDPRPHCPDCTRTESCERPCYAGAPRRLPSLTECAP